MSENSLVCETVVSDNIFGVVHCEAQTDRGIVGPQGPEGPTGVSVTGVSLISTEGINKTYRMSFSDGTHFDYIVQDGASGTNVPWGGITGTLSNQLDLQAALDAKQATLVSGTNLKTVNNNSLLGSGNISIDSLPSQTGNNGKFLTTNGSTASWAALEVSGKAIGEVYYSQSASASDNPGGLPLFTGEKIYGADQLYPDFYTWVASHNELQISDADYETALTTYGECPKYVIDTVNHIIRLPKLANYVKMANTTEGITQQGAGLPNITGGITGQAKMEFQAASGAFSLGSSTGGNNAGSSSGFKSNFNFDASDSNAIYGNSNTVTPAHTTLYPWVCAYSAAIPASTAQAAEFQTALTGKADVSLGNLTRSGKNVIAGNAAPCNAVQFLTLGTSGDSYRAPADGYVTFSKKSTASSQYIEIMADNGMRVQCLASGSGQDLSVFLPVGKNMYFDVSYNAAGTTNQFMFIYSEGARTDLP